jgi:REP-associated tyrosine transposase
MARPPRLPSFSYRGPYCYFLTFCTYRRRAHFCSSDIAAMVVRHFRRTARREGFAILAYCLMPDHAHLLVEGTRPESDLRRFVKGTKQSSGHVYSRMNDDPLWDEGYHDRVLRKDTDLREVARYIVWNPVRAGLTATPSQYGLRHPLIEDLSRL